jgi:ribosomal protein L11 methyltransferase
MTADNREFSLELMAGAEGFGSGEHPTTQTMLQAMYAMAAVQEFRHILDMGCGSGLLAMTAAHLWPHATIVAADINARAVQVATQNVAHNGLQDRITIVRSNGYRHAVIAATAPYDLILCNMTADPILQLASDLASNLSEDGAAILSGVLLWRSAEVLTMHAQLGLESRLPTLHRDGWETHVLVKRKIAQDV